MTVSSPLPFLPLWQPFFKVPLQLIACIAQGLIKGVGALAAFPGDQAHSCGPCGGGPLLPGLEKGLPHSLAAAGLCHCNAQDVFQ